MYDGWWVVVNRDELYGWRITVPLDFGAFNIIGGNDIINGNIKKFANFI